MPATADGYATGFASALLDPDRAVPRVVRATAGLPATKRFGVYRNNVVSSLASALEDIFPAVRRIVGDEFFRAMATVFVREHPPRSPLLFTYGSGFARFIDGFAPAARLRYLSDVARLERAWLDAYHAADAAPLELSALAAVEPERLGTLRLVAHPALAILPSRYAVVTIFSANRGQSEQHGTIAAAVAQTALVTRPRFDVEVRSITPGTAAFAASLAAGDTLGAAVGDAVSVEPEFDLATALATLAGASAFTAILHDAQG